MLFWIFFPFSIVNKMLLWFNSFLNGWILFENNTESNSLSLLEWASWNAGIRCHLHYQANSALNLQHERQLKRAWVFFYTSSFTFKPQYREISFNSWNYESFSRSTSLVRFPLPPYVRLHRKRVLHQNRKELVNPALLRSQHFDYNLCKRTTTTWLSLGAKLRL